MHPDTFYTIAKQKALKLQEYIVLVPILWRKPEAFRYWLLNAHKAQIFALLLALLTPFAIIPLIDLLLATIFSPVTNDVLFGLIKTEHKNPYIDSVQTIAAWVIWILATLLCAALFLRHIPGTLQHAKEIVEEKVLAADRLININPSESILLYNAAKKWALDENNETSLNEKLQSVTTATYQTGIKAPVAPAKTVILSTPIAKSGDTLIADRYLIKKLIGSGAMGNVYHGEDTLLKRDIALKQLSPRLSHDEHIIARFRQEALALARLSHPNIVQVYDFIEGEGFFWIVMELVTGGELEEKLSSSNPLKPGEALRLARLMAAALGYAHTQGVIHRDFKPANVLITDNGDVKITDFGIAKLAQSSIHTQLNTIMGTPSHMSPEQANGDATDHRTDIYALGIVLYQMICGELPFNGDAKSIIAQHLTKQAPRLLKKHPHISPSIDNIIQKMLAKTPDERFQSMLELEKALTEK